MALYWHFRSKDELLEGLAERIWSEIDTDRRRARRRGRTQLRGLLESLLRVLRAHPAASELLLHSEKQQRGRARTPTEVTLGLLRDGRVRPGARERDQPAPRCGPASCW